MGIFFILKKFLIPTKLATNSDLGFVKTSLGVPFWMISPSCKTAILLAREIASSY